MDVRQAITIAKQHVAELFGDEGAQDIGLEEVKRDGRSGNWLVTVGFARPWDSRTSSIAKAFASPQRTYKIVDIQDADGQVVAVTHRSFEAA